MHTSPFGGVLDINSKNIFSNCVGEINIMNESIVNEICLKSFNEYPSRIKFFEIGYGNYVYKVYFGKKAFVLRINNDKHDYKDTGLIDCNL